MIQISISKTSGTPAGLANAACFQGVRTPPSDVYAGLQLCQQPGEAGPVWTGAEEMALAAAWLAAALQPSASARCTYMAGPGMR